MRYDREGWLPVDEKLGALRTSQFPEGNRIRDICQIDIEQFPHTKHIIPLLIPEVVSPLFVSGTFSTAHTTIASFMNLLAPNDAEKWSKKVAAVG